MNRLSGGWVEGNKFNDPKKNVKQLQKSLWEIKHIKFVKKNIFFFTSTPMWKIDKVREKDEKVFRSDVAYLALTQMCCLCGTKRGKNSVRNYYSTLHYSPCLIQFLTWNSSSSSSSKSNDKVCVWTFFCWFDSSSTELLLLLHTSRIERLNYKDYQNEEKFLFTLSFVQRK